MLSDLHSHNRQPYTSQRWGTYLPLTAPGKGAATLTLLTETQASGLFFCKGAKVHEKKGIAMSYFIISLSSVTLCTIIFTYPLFLLLFLFCRSPISTFPVAMFKVICALSFLLFILRFLFLSEGGMLRRQDGPIVCSSGPRLVGHDPKMDHGSVFGHKWGWKNNHALLG